MSEKIVFEDLVQFHDKWATGISGRNVGPQQLSLLDILNRAKGDTQHPNNIEAQGPDINGSQMMVELMGDLYVQSEKLKDALKTTGNSVILRDRPDARAQIKKMIKKTELVQKMVHSIGKDVDDFSVDKSEK